MVTYKYLNLTADGQFVSPVSNRVWRGLKMKGRGAKEERRQDWVWSCMTPDNHELRSYCDETSVLVTLEVWGRVVVRDNGVVQSEYARIIGYDSDDYYYVLHKYGKISISEALSLISPSSYRLPSLLENDLADVPFGIIANILEKNPTPRLAYLIAKNYYKKPESKTRSIALLDPWAAYMYALEVDRSPSDDTRLVACQDPRVACSYARDVDRAVHPLTRQAAYSRPDTALTYARTVDKRPNKKSRQICCEYPETAFEYALHVDRRPRDDTRQAACKSSYYAFRYAWQVDKQPREDTREAACQASSHAYEYALHVDRGPHPLTRQTACREPYFAYCYAVSIDDRPHPQTESGVKPSRRWSRAYRQWLRRKQSLLICDFVSLLVNNFE